MGRGEDLLAALEDRRSIGKRSASDKTIHTTVTTHASDASLQRRLELAHQRIHQQAEEITKLRAALARAHGDLRAVKTSPTTAL